MKASETLKAWIREHEGFTTTAYFDDYAGTPDVVEYSIGYGHQIQPGQEYLKTAVITQATAQALMDADLAVWETFINNQVKKNLTQNQFDALVNLCYAVGGGNAKPIITLINSGASFDDIKNTWLKIGTYWQGSYRPGLIAMREREVKMYQSGMTNPLMIILVGSAALYGLLWLAKKL